MFSETDQPCMECPDSECAQPYIVSKCGPEVKGTIFHDWKIITGGMNSGFI